MIAEKKCTKCKLLKPLELFCKNKTNKDGHNYQCKNCQYLSVKEYKNKNQYTESNRKYRQLNTDKIKRLKQEHYKSNKEKILKKHREYNLKNKDALKKTASEKYVCNKDKILKSRHVYYVNNKDKVKSYQKEYRKKNKKKINDRNKKNKLKINYNIEQALRIRILRAIKRSKNIKSDSTINLIGCNIDLFKSYIESKFTKGMTWENRGLYGWHLDHIKPCSSFDLSCPKQQKQCFHYTNIQPLWATTEIAMKYGESSKYIGNLEKGDRNDF